MIKFKSINEFEKMRNQDLVPPIIANAVIGDLLMMKEYIADDYYSTEEVDKYGPFVAVMTRDEYRKIEELIPTIEKDSYEYQDIVGIDDNGYITKLLYLFSSSFALSINLWTVGLGFLNWVSSPPIIKFVK